MESKIICIYLQKGGVGKSTMTCSFAYELSKYGKTLIIDGDTQGSITSFLTKGIPENKTFLKSLMEEIPVKEAIQEVRKPDNDYYGLYILGTKVEEKLIDYLGGPFKEDPEVLEDLLVKISNENFKYILFDLPPSLDFFERRVLKNCDVIIPIIEPEDSSIDQFKIFAKEMEKIKKRYGKTYEGSNFLIINKKNKSKDVHNAYSELLKNSFEVYEFIDSKIVSKAINSKLTLQEYDSGNKLCKTISELTDKIK